MEGNSLLAIFPSLFVSHTVIFTQYTDKQLPENTETDDMFSGALFIHWGAPCDVITASEPSLEGEGGKLDSPLKTELLYPITLLREGGRRQWEGV